MRRLRTIIALACVLACITACKDAAIDCSSWMSGLPDDMPAWKVSLPGSHDAATSGIPEGTVEHLTTCTQSFTLAEQFDKGIRCFDLRPGFAGTEAGDMYIMHSIVNTGVRAYEAIGTIAQKVRENPSEFAVIVFRIENNDFTPEVMAAAQDSLSFLESKFAGEGVVMDTYKAGMSVADMRGKVLIINRNSFGESYWCGCHATGWGGIDSIVSRDGASSSPIDVQDDYEWEDDDKVAEGKLASFTSHAARFAAEAESGEFWGVNHISGYFRRDDLARPHEFAEAVAPAVCGWLANDKGNSPLGAVMMDYAGDPAYKGDEIIRHIIERNFR